MSRTQKFTFANKPSGEYLGIYGIIGVQILKSHCTYQSTYTTGRKQQNSQNFTFNESQLQGLYFPNIKQRLIYYGTLTERC